MLLNLAFSLTVRRPPLGTNFPLFYATGIVPFFLFTGISGAVASAVATNRGLLHYPVVSPLDAVFGKFILNFLTMLVVGVLLSTGIIIVYALPVTLDPVSALIGFTLIGLLGLGVGTHQLRALRDVPDLAQRLERADQAALHRLGHLLHLRIRCRRPSRHIIWWNPLVHGVALVRAGFYGSYDPYYVSIPLRARGRRQPLRDRRLPPAPARELADRELAVETGPAALEVAGKRLESGLPIRRSRRA